MKRILIACGLCAMAGVSAGYMGGKFLKPSGQGRMAERNIFENGSFAVGANGGNPRNNDGSEMPFVLRDKSMNLLLELRQGKLTAGQLEEVYRRLLEEMNKNDTHYNEHHDQETYMILRELGRQWGLSGPRQALAELEKGQTGKGKSCELHKKLIFAVFKGWAERDPEAAGQYYMQNRERLAAIGPVLYMKEWVQSDPAGAWYNLSTLSNYEKKNGLVIFFESVFQSHPEKAGEFMNKLDKSQWENDQFIASIVNQWNREDKEGLDKWLEGLPPGQQDKVKAFNAMYMVEKFPDEAGKILSSLSQADQERALKEMGWKLDVMKAREEINWISQYTSEELLVKQMPRIMNNFENESQEGLHAWLKELPQGKLRESALVLYSNIRYSEEVDYAVRLDLVQTIRDTGKRDSAIQNVLYGWASIDPERTRQWLENSSVREQAKEDLRSYMETMPNIKDPKCLFKE